MEDCMAAEKEALVRRANVRLAYALRTTLPGGSRAELDRLIEEDMRLAQASLVSLLAEDGTIDHKHVDKLTLEALVTAPTPPCLLVSTQIPKPQTQAV
jgi:hypothetical protein